MAEKSFFSKVFLASPGFEPTAYLGCNFWELDAKPSRLHFEEELVLFAAQKQVGGLGLWVSAL